MVLKDNHSLPPHPQKKNFNEIASLWSLVEHFHRNDSLDETNPKDALIESAIVEIGAAENQKGRETKKISRQKWEEMQGIRKLQVLIMPLIETVIEWRLACDSWWGADRKSISHRPTDDGSSLIKTVILHRSLSSSFVFFYGLDPSIVKARPDCIGLFGVGLLFYCLFFLRLVSDKHQLQLPNFTRVLLA